MSCTTCLILLARIFSWGHVPQRVCFESFLGRGGGPTGAVSKSSGMQGPGCGLGPLLPGSSSDVVAEGLSVQLIPGNKGEGGRGGSQMKTQVSFLFPHPRLALLDL